MHIEVPRRLQASAPIATTVLNEIAADKTVSARVRVDAAKALLDRSGHVAPKTLPRRDLTER